MPERLLPALFSLNDEIQYRILGLLEARPDISQRELSKELGVSLGKTN